MLKVKGINVHYSGMKALSEITVLVKEGQLVSVIGPNGAGKSTLLKAISGIVKCTSGEIYYMDTNITNVEAYKRSELGIIHVPEGRRIFPTLTVMENLELGAYRSKARALASKSIEMVLEFFPVLKARCNQLGGTLSGGEQQMLAIGRGLMAMPLLLMLDEPSLGLSPLVVELIFGTVEDIRKKLNFAILLVEQRAFEALDLCDWCYILESGKVSMNSDRESMIGNSKVQKAYLGTA